MSKLSITEDELAEELKRFIQNKLRANRGWEIDLADLRPIIHEHLDRLINTPETHDFMTAVPLEAVHQVERWGVEHDAGKEPEDFFWLLAYLGGKCLRACIEIQREIEESGKPLESTVDKAKHHTISTAAVLLNWHKRISGEEVSFQPGSQKAAADGK